jgi:hypothetical protein
MRQNVNIGDERLFGKYGEVAIVEQAELFTRYKKRSCRRWEV